MAINGVKKSAFMSLQCSRVTTESRRNNLAMKFRFKLHFIFTAPIEMIRN